MLIQILQIFRKNCWNDGRGDCWNGIVRVVGVLAKKGQLGLVGLG